MIKNIIVKLIVRYLKKHNHLIEWDNQTIFMCSTSLFKDMRKAYDEISEAKIKKYKKILEQKTEESGYIYQCLNCGYRSKYPMHICPNCLEI